MAALPRLVKQYQRLFEISLPKALMRQARLAKDHAPIKAAVTAQLAVAIAIETFCAHPPPQSHRY
jgi:hypothetical protein